ncbi:hypothetical protein EG850_04340 [Gulosibacter macacae]|uniref:Chromosome partitioning protein n=1 Tax=Gulosibacter macacae TaxID=2488791 RepID=A0A3P3VXM5_9MICO|nr:hypothetical protein [Gulosibacter macacae]RRJ87535.1 hypothetical protein EG850_04340 [Gulosibacter macacae]
MAQESTDFARELVALIRADGQGELRDGDHVTRMRAADADELRGMVMERAMAVAADEGRTVHVRTIDVDGVYPLVLSPEGGIDQNGDIEPLAPGDIDLTPEAEEPAEGYSDLFRSHEDGEDEPPTNNDSVHETISLPRPGMMAPLPEGPMRFAGEDADGNELEDVDDDADLDEFHDEALDHDFDDLESVADEVNDDAERADDVDPDAELAFEDEDAAAEGAESDSDDESGDESADESVTEDASEWSPAFARDGRRAHTRVSLGAAPEPQPGYPEVPLFDEEPLDKVAPPPAQTPTPTRQSAPAVTARNASGEAPTLDDFFAASDKSRKSVAEQGWRASLRRASGGLISLGPGARERAERDEIAAIQRPFAGPRTIVVVNPKGGAHKTTATLMIAATFGTFRGGYTLAWDNNETRGTLGWRSRPGATKNTAVDLLRELPKFEISGGATISDVDRYVRNQGNAKFDVLASDDDAASAAIIDDDAFSRLHRTLSRFYRIMVVDTGNNMRASNWEAALDVADQLVVVSTAREDTAASAAWLADGLRERGYGELLANAVTIISSPSEKDDEDLHRKLEAHFAKLTRAVVSVPYDQEFVGGGELDIPRLQPATREAWRRAAAVIAQGL